MTPDRIDEIEADLCERVGGWCMRVDVDADECDPDHPATHAFAVLVVDVRGGALTVEFRINDSGHAEMFARAFSDDEPADPVVFAMPGSVMVTT